jgi:hypothetical protein
MSDACVRCYYYFYYIFFSLISLCAVVTELFSLWSVLYTSFCENVSSEVVSVRGSVWLCRCYLFNNADTTTASLSVISKTEISSSEFGGPDC